MTFNYFGNDIDFRDIFYLYLNGVEGYRVKVYKDIYGNDTVGLGHLVRQTDNLSYGEVITEPQVIQLFYNDYNNLNIEQYVDEAAQNYNQALAIAHFVWSHGFGDYNDSELRQHLIKHDLDYNGMITHLNSHWDVNKPSNQKVNNADFAIYYSSNPWKPNKDLSYFYNQITNFLSNSAATNPIATYGVAAGTLLISVSLLTYAVIRLRKK